MPKLKPMAEWLCDACGEIIASPEDGWIEWFDAAVDRETWPSERECHTFRIVHHSSKSPRGDNGCYLHKGEVVSGERSTHLEHVLGFSGMVEMLRILEDGVRDPKEWAEVFRRLYAPYYEEHRLHPDDEEAREAFEAAIHFSTDPLLAVDSATRKRIEEYHDYRTDPRRAEWKTRPDFERRVQRMAVEDMATLLATADDAADCGNVLWVSKAGLVYITPSTDFDPESPDVQFRWESFGCGNGYCGERAACDDAYVREKLEELQRDWREGRKGYIDY